MKQKATKIKLGLASALGILLVGGVFLAGIVAIYTRHNASELNESEVVPTEYIAVFNGGVGERIYSTYIYKLDNGQANYGFEYIDTVKTTVSYGSPEWEVKIVGRGTVGWTDEVFMVAENNHADTYVRLPSSDEVYTLDEFRSMFLMN